MFLRRTLVHDLRPPRDAVPVPPVAPAQIAAVAFKGIFAVSLLLGEDGRRRVAPNEIADALGLNWSRLARGSLPPCPMHWRASPSCRRRRC
jgi:hypothetical protein